MILGTLTYAAIKKPHLHLFTILRNKGLNVNNDMKGVAKLANVLLIKVSHLF